MVEPFPDRRAELFGREIVIGELIDRANRPGVTALVARPSMGKSWTLTEVARRLQDDYRHLVGYHELKGGETSHLLYAVSDLYARWLSDSRLREQAVLFWEQHKDDWLARVGGVVGELFEKLSSGLLPPVIPALVKVGFEALGKAQKDMTIGGLELPRLPYEQALSLARMVYEVSDRPVVLILDAWEQSPSMHHEKTFLQAFLRHLGDWPPIHIFLAVRYPDPISASASEAHQTVSDLCSIFPAAARVELPPMDLASPQEWDRLAAFIRDRVDGAKQLADQSLRGSIGGYPGVVDRWRNLPPQQTERTQDHLELEAAIAHSGQYPELGELVNSLAESPLHFAASLALLPGLDAGRWNVYKDLLLSDEKDFHLLVDSQLLTDEPFPSFGHDTRHRAMQTWFVKHRKPLMRRVAQQCIERLASRISGVNSSSLPLFEALLAIRETARQVGVHPEFLCLLDAAAIPFGDVEATQALLFDDLPSLDRRHNNRFTPLVGQALYNRGIFKGRRGDWDGAVADYTAVIELPHAPPEQVAAALNNRGVKKSQRGDVHGAIADYTAVIELQEAPEEVVATALNNRGTRLGEQGDIERAIADFSAVIEHEQSLTAQVARALYSRGIAKAQRGDSTGAIADYTTLIRLPNAPADLVAEAMYNRGFANLQRGNSDAAFRDFTVVSEQLQAPIAQVTKALNHRGLIKSQRGDSKGAIADYT